MGGGAGDAAPADRGVVFRVDAQPGSDAPLGDALRVPPVRTPRAAAVPRQPHPRGATSSSRGREKARPRLTSRRVAPSRSSFYSSASSDDGDSVVTQEWGEMAAPPAPRAAASPPRFTNINRFRGLVDPNPGPVRESPPASAGRERLRSSREWQGRVATALSRSARLGASVDASDENGGGLAGAAWATPGGATPARRSVQLEDGGGARGRLFGRELRSNRSLEVRRAGKPAPQTGGEGGGRARSLRDLRSRASRPRLSACACASASGKGSCSCSGSARTAWRSSWRGSRR